MSDRYHDLEEADDEDDGDREARVAYALTRALSLSEELKTTVSELAEMLQSANEEGGLNRGE